MRTSMLIVLMTAGLLLSQPATAGEWADSPLGKTTFGDLWMGPASSPRTSKATWW